MKKFRFCALCLILAALLSACGRQAAQDVPGAAAVPSPAAVPEAPAESTSTPSPTAPAEIGKEFDDLSFLNEEQRQAYEGAYKLNYTLYGLPDNLVGVDVSPRFTQQSDNEGVFVLTVGNYALYENPYTDFTNLMQSVFTTDFIRRLGPLYTEKFIDLDGHLATSCDSVLACPMHEIQKFLLIILIRNAARYGAKTLPLIFYFYKRESYNNLCISKHQCSLAYTANHITHRLKETQNSKMAYKKRGLHPSPTGIQNAGSFIITFYLVFHQAGWPSTARSSLNDRSG